MLGVNALRSDPQSAKEQELVITDLSFIVPQWDSSEAYSGLSPSEGHHQLPTAVTLSLTKFLVFLLSLPSLLRYVLSWITAPINLLHPESWLGVHFWGNQWSHSLWCCCSLGSPPSFSSGHQGFPHTPPLGWGKP